MTAGNDWSCHAYPRRWPSSESSSFSYSPLHRLKKYPLTVDKSTLKNFLNLLTLLPWTSLRLKKNRVRVRVAYGYRDNILKASGSTKSLRFESESLIFSLLDVSQFYIHFHLSTIFFLNTCIFFSWILKLIKQKISEIFKRGISWNIFIAKSMQDCRGLIILTAKWNSWLKFDYS